MIRVKNHPCFPRLLRSEGMEYEIESDELVSMAVIRAVSAMDGRGPCSLPPLADELDPDALDSLFAPGPEGSPRNGGHLSFVYAGYRVGVDDAEYLTIESVDRLGAGLDERADPR